MRSVSECVVSALEPYVGPLVASTCLGATAISLGKTRDEIDASDMPTLSANVRRLLAPVAPSATIDAIISDIAKGCR